MCFVFHLRSISLLLLVNLKPKDLHESPFIWLLFSANCQLIKTKHVSICFIFYWQNPIVEIDKCIYTCMCLHIHTLAKKDCHVIFFLFYCFTPTNKPRWISKNMKLNIAVQKGINGLFTALIDNLWKKRPEISLITRVPVVLVNTSFVTKCYSTVVTSHEGFITNIIVNKITWKAIDWSATQRKDTLVSIITCYIFNYKQQMLPHHSSC